MEPRSGATPITATTSMTCGFRSRPISTRIADNNPSVRVRFELSSDPGIAHGRLERRRRPDRLDQCRRRLRPRPQRQPPRSHQLSQSLRADDRSHSVHAGDGPGAPAGFRYFRAFGSGSLRGNAEPGPHRILWVGTDNAGKQVAAGTYFCRAQGAGGSRAVRIVRLP